MVSLARPRCTNCFEQPAATFAASILSQLHALESVHVDNESGVSGNSTWRLIAWTRVPYIVAGDSDVTHHLLDEGLFLLRRERAGS